MKVVDIELTKLIPYENNPRKNDLAIEPLANSIREFGFNNPIAIDKNNVIVCGHTRYEAAKLLGLKKVPCVKLDNLSEEKINAFRLADNKVGELAIWDFDKLELELSSIADLDMSEFGFADNSEEYLDDILAEESGKASSQGTMFSITFTFDKSQYEDIYSAFLLNHTKEEMQDALIKLWEGLEDA